MKYLTERSLLNIEGVKIMIKEIGTPKIIKLNIDLEKKLQKGEKLTAQFIGGVMVPKEIKDDVCYASMNFLIKTASEKIIVSLMIQSKVVCTIEKNETEPRDISIKNQVFPTLVDWIKSYYNKLCDNTIIKLPDFPVMNLQE